jgi:hypothetical protein
MAPVFPNTPLRQPTIRDRVRGADRTSASRHSGGPAATTTAASGAPAPLVDARAHQTEPNPGDVVARRVSSRTHASLRITGGPSPLQVVPLQERPLTTLRRSHASARQGTSLQCGYRRTAVDRVAPAGVAHRSGDARRGDAGAAIHVRLVAPLLRPAHPCVLREQAHGKGALYYCWRIWALGHWTPIHGSEGTAPSSQICPWDRRSCRRPKHGHHCEGAAGRRRCQWTRARGRRAHSTRRGEEPTTKGRSSVHGEHLRAVRRRAAEASMLRGLPGCQQPQETATNKASSAAPRRGRTADGARDR